MTRGYMLMRFYASPTGSSYAVLDKLYGKYRVTECVAGRKVQVRFQTVEGALEMFNSAVKSEIERASTENGA